MTTGSSARPRWTSCAWCGAAKSLRCRCSGQSEVSQKCAGKEYYSLWHLEPYLDPDASFSKVLTGLHTRTECRLLATGSASGAFSICACTLTVKMAWHFSAWLHATGQLPSANRTWSAAVHDGQLTWNHEAGAVVPKPLGMAAGRQHGLNGKGPVLSHGKSFRKTLKLSGRLIANYRAEWDRQEGGSADGQGGSAAEW